MAKSRRKGSPSRTPKEKDILHLLESAGLKGADCLSDRQIDALGNFTVNELKVLARAQEALPYARAGSV
jgi:hypothetical protein